MDPILVEEVECENNGYTLDTPRDRLRPRDMVETTLGGDEYVVSYAAAPVTVCNVPNPDVVSKCGLSELPRSIHSDDENDRDAFFVQTCVKEVQNADYATPEKPLFSMRREEPLDEELDHRSRLREYLDSKRRVVEKRLCYAKPSRSSHSLKQRPKEHISQIKEDLEITTWQREVDLKLIKSVMVPM